MIDMQIAVPPDSDSEDGYLGDLAGLSGKMMNTYPNCIVRVRVTKVRKTDEFIETDDKKSGKLSE